MGGVRKEGATVRVSSRSFTFRCRAAAKNTANGRRRRAPPFVLRNPGNDANKCRPNARRNIGVVGNLGNPVRRIEPPDQGPGSSPVDRRGGRGADRLPPWQRGPGTDQGGR